ncbi:hypothetical protein [Aquabacterium sp.]|uniref:hypothetical protein n=1 Tax=Aquabacterium sp. TaxID=1872578 RepID=UPI003783BEFA
MDEDRSAPGVDERPVAHGTVLRYRAQPAPGAPPFPDHRRIGSVPADRWDAIERGSARADWIWPTCDALARVHRSGRTLLAAVNISTAVPADRYAPTISDPVTRRAAKVFLRAYVQWLLDNVGAAALTIDADIVAQRGLDQPGSEDRGRAWAQWYVEAAELARSAAAERGKSARLKLLPCLGGMAQGWQREVVEASDGLAPEVEAVSRDGAFDCHAIDGEDLAARLRKGRRPVPLRFNDGDDFEFLRYRDPGLGAGSSPASTLLQLRLAAPGDLLLQVNGHWLAQRGQQFDIDLTAHYAIEGPNVIDVLATGPAFPVDQQVEMLTLVQT